MGMEWSGGGLESVKDTNPSTCCPFFSCSQPKIVAYSWYEIFHSCLLLPRLCFNHSHIHTILYLKSSCYKQAHLKCLCSFPSNNLAMGVQIHLTLRFPDDIILQRRSKKENIGVWRLLRSSFFLLQVLGTKWKVIPKLCWLWYNE